MDIRRTVIFLLALFFLTSFTVSAVAGGGEYLWDFTGEGGSLDSGSWRLKRGTLEDAERGLDIKEGSFPVIFSPVGLDIPSSENVFYIRLKTDKPGLATLSLFSAHTNFAYSISFRVRASKDYRDYRVYFKEVIAGGDYIYDFALKLPGNNLNASIESIAFYEPTWSELFSVFWDGFWEPEPIGVGTSNLIEAPGFGSLTFLTVLYILTPLLIVLALIILYFYSGRITGKLFFKAILIGFAISALFFTLRMDFNWLVIWGDDLENLRGKEVGERLRALNYGNYDSYYDFIDEVREIVPEGSKARPAGRYVNDYNDHVARSVAYYLLPVRSAPNADYLWLYFDEVDSGITYNPDKGTLVRGPQALPSRVRPVRIFGGDAALYKVIGPGEGKVSP